MRAWRGSKGDDLRTIQEDWSCDDLAAVLMFLEVEEAEAERRERPHRQRLEDMLNQRPGGRRPR